MKNYLDHSQPTQKQQDFLDYIRDYIDEHGYSPTVRDLGQHFGISLNGVVCHLKALIKKGYITMPNRLARSIRLVMQSPFEVRDVSTRERTLISVQTRGPLSLDDAKRLINQLTAVILNTEKELAAAGKMIGDFMNDPRR